MATTKISKVQADIEKAKERMAEQQAKLKELEAKQTELENIEIVEIVRGLNIPLDNLAAVLQSVKGTVIPSTIPTPGQTNPKQKSNAPKTDTEKEEIPE